MDRSPPASGPPLSSLPPTAAETAADALRTDPPDYYNGAGGLQPFDVVDAFGLDFYEGNVVKYLVRWRKKGGVADLRKARTYIDKAIALAEAQGRA